MEDDKLEKLKLRQGANKSISLPEPDISVKSLKSKLNVDVNEDFDKNPYGSNLFATKEAPKLLITYPLFLITNIKRSELYNFVIRQIADINLAYEESYQKYRLTLGAGTEPNPPLKLLPLLISDTKGGAKVVAHVYPGVQFVNFCKVLNLTCLYYVAKGKTEEFKSELYFDYSQWNERICPSDDQFILKSYRTELELEALSPKNVSEEDVLKSLIADEVGDEVYQALIQGTDSKVEEVDFNQVQYKPPTPEQEPDLAKPVYYEEADIDTEETTDMLVEDVMPVTGSSTGFKAPTLEEAQWIINDTSFVEDEIEDEDIPLYNSDSTIEDELASEIFEADE